MEFDVSEVWVGGMVEADGWNIRIDWKQTKILMFQKCLNKNIYLRSNLVKG